MSKLAVGSKLPAFTARTADGEPWKSADAAGQKLVVYFYPKDMTPGCTVEAQEFRDAAAGFRKARATVVGVSRDSCASHARFRDKEKLNFELLVFKCRLKSSRSLVMDRTLKDMQLKFFI